MNRKGYTLLEVLAVLAIIAITASLVTVKIQESINKVDETACFNKMRLIALAEKRFYTTNGKHSLEFVSGEAISETSQLVRTGYLDWNNASCQSCKWSVNAEGDYVLACDDHQNLSLVQGKEEYSDALFVKFPDDGNNSGGSTTPTNKDDYLVGTPQDDTIDALNGNDTIYGLGGDDTLIGNNGKDTIYGGPGDDYLSGGNQNDTISGGEDDDYISGGNGNDIINGDSGDDTIDGGNGRDTISGGTGEDIIYGANGNDIIYGGDDDDEIYGESGADKITGGLGDDDIYGGSGKDRAIYEYDYLEYSLIKHSKSHYEISHPVEGTDQLYNIERLQFANKSGKIEKIYELLK